MRPTPPLLALAVGAFGIGVTEFAPMGMLPVIAGDLGVSIPAAGLLVSAYAAGVLVGAPVMTLLFARTPRRLLLIGLMGIFTLGNLLSAIAPDYWMLLGARVVTSFNHGAFFGVGAVVAASLVSADRQAGAVAAMFSRLTIATIGGVPFAAFAAESLGWRPVFLACTAVGLAAMIALRLSLRPMQAAEGVDMRAELRVLRRGPVLSALLLTVLGASAMFTVFTYIAPILLKETGASAGFVTAMLALYGLGLTIGNWLGGRLADHSMDGTLIGSLAALVAVLALFSVGMEWPSTAAPLIFLWGIASFAIVPPLQMRVVAEAAQAPNLASAMNVGAFNLGNAIGAALGGGIIDAGLGLPAVSIAGALAASSGLALLLTQKGWRPSPASAPSRC